jgi:hypothetical protein
VLDSLLAINILRSKQQGRRRSKTLPIHPSRPIFIVQLISFIQFVRCVLGACETDQRAVTSVLGVSTRGKKDERQTAVAGGSFCHVTHNNSSVA